MTESEVLDNKVYPSIPDAQGYFFKTKDDEADDNKSRIYPSPADDEGFFAVDETEDIMGISTKKYDNGNEVKRVVLKDGRIAIIRELKAWEMEETERFHKQNKELLIMAITAKAMKIDDKNIAFEEVKNLRAKDWAAIKNAVTIINFL